VGVGPKRGFGPLQKVLISFKVSLLAKSFLPPKKYYPSQIVLTGTCTRRSYIYTGIHVQSKINYAHFFVGCLFTVVILVVVVFHGT
jgi:hypothetical protein